MTKNVHVCTICCRLEVDNDVISGMAVDNVGVGVPIKFGDSRSNGFQDIRGADFVSNERTIERTNEHKMAYSNSAKRDRVSPEKLIKTTEQKCLANPSHPLVVIMV